MAMRITQQDIEAAKRLIAARQIPSADGATSGAEVLAKIDNRRIATAQQLTALAGKYRSDQRLGDTLTRDELIFAERCRELASSQREAVTNVRRDREEQAKRPMWDGCLGMNRDRRGTPLTHKRAPSPFQGLERFAIRDSLDVEYTTITNEHGVFVRTEALPGYLTVEDEVCPRGYPSTDAKAIDADEYQAKREAQRSIDAENCREAHRRSLAIARSNGTLKRTRGRKH